MLFKSQLVILFLGKKDDLHLIRWSFIRKKWWILYNFSIKMHLGLLKLRNLYLGGVRKGLPLFVFNLLSYPPQPPPTSAFQQVFGYRMSNLTAILFFLLVHVCSNKPHSSAHTLVSLFQWFNWIFTFFHYKI